MVKNMGAEEKSYSHTSAEIDIVELKKQGVIRK